VCELLEPQFKANKKNGLAFTSSKSFLFILYYFLFLNPLKKTENTNKKLSFNCQKLSKPKSKDRVTKHLNGRVDANENIRK
jgi:hypothetical protein